LSTSADAGVGLSINSITIPCESFMEASSSIIEVRDGSPALAPALAS
jgi:hypothetical protein